MRRPCSKPECLFVKVFPYRRDTSKELQTWMCRLEESCSALVKKCGVFVRTFAIWRCGRPDFNSAFAEIHICIFVQATGFTGVVLNFKVERQRHFLEEKMLTEGTHEIWTSFSCVFASISNIFPTSSGTRLRKVTNAAKALRRQKQTTHFLQSCKFKKRRLVGASGWKVLRTHPYLQSCTYGCVEM